MAPLWGDMVGYTSPSRTQPQTSPAMDNTNLPQDDSIPPLPALPPLPGANRAESPPPWLKPLPTTVAAYGSGPSPVPVFPQFGLSRPGIIASGPWSFPEHRLFEQGCIMHGWGHWKKIQEFIPGRSKDQCKSHGQKFLKSHPHEKERLLTEHRNMMQLQHQQIEQQQKKATTKYSSRMASRKRPERKARKAPQKKQLSKNNATMPGQPDIVPNMTYNNEFSNLGGVVCGKKEESSKSPVNFATDSIDTICKDIHERNNVEGLCNSKIQNDMTTSCANDRPEFKQPGVEELLSLSVAVSASMDEEGVPMTNNNWGGHS